MLSLAKRSLKKVLPASMLHWIRETSELARLSLVSERFDPSNLLRGEHLSLPEVFSSTAIDALWNNDCVGLQTFFGTSERAEGVNPGDRRALYYLTTFLKPQRILEIGTHVGASTAHIAVAARRFGGRVTTVDIADVNSPEGPWRRASLQTSPAEICRSLGCDVEFVVRGGDQYLRESVDSFDLIFLDGDHSAPAVYTELALSMKRLAPHGAIVLHDYYPSGPFFADDLPISGPAVALRRAMREAAGFSARPLGELPWPTKRGSRRTSLAIVLAD